MQYDIVIIEDEVDLGNVISAYLKLRGFTVLWFKTATEALNYYIENVRQNKLIIIDVQLPDSNGFDLSAQIMKINPNQAFFFLTAHNEKQDRLRGLKIGAIDFDQEITPNNHWLRFWVVNIGGDDSSARRHFLTYKFSRDIFWQVSAKSLPWMLLA